MKRKQKTCVWLLRDGFLVVGCAPDRFFELKRKRCPICGKPIQVKEEK